jgi:hypothetical protein
MGTFQKLVAEKGRANPMTGSDVVVPVAVIVSRSEPSAPVAWTAYEYVVCGQSKLSVNAFPLVEPTSRAFRRMR